MVEEVDPLLIQQQTPVADDPLQRLAGLVDAYRCKQAEAEQLAKQLKEVEAAAKEFLESTLPEYMLEVGISKVDLSDGSTVSIESKTFATIKADNAEAAHQWLRDNGHGDIIKCSVTGTFAMGEEENAKSLQEWLGSKDVPATRKVAVPPPTLKKWAREMNEKGIAFPHELFGVFQQSIAKIGKPKR